MKKTALRHSLEQFIKKYPIQFRGVNINAAEFYLDLESDNDLILEIINEGANYGQFLAIIRMILNNERNSDIYKKEDEGVYAMRIRNKTNNSRIYCQDYWINGKRIIVMSKAVRHKAVVKNNAEILSKILSIQKTTFILKQIKDEE